MSLSGASQAIRAARARIIAGGVYLLRDDVIRFPQSEHANRTKHPFRIVMVLSNQTTCNSIASPVVTVVPLSHILSPRAETDLVLGRTRTNGLDKDSRLLFGFVQPVLKDHLEKLIGQLDEIEWQQVMGKIVWNFDR
jgi:hypothetical protein